MSGEQKGLERNENGTLQKSMENERIVHLERINLNRVKTMMQGCDAGKECLDFLEKEKCEVVSEEVKGKAALNFEKKKITLSPFLSEESAALILIRETCMLQNCRDNGFDALREQFMHRRENSECVWVGNMFAQQARFAYEMQGKNPDVRKKFCEKYADIYKEYKNTFVKTKDVCQAMTETVKKVLPAYQLNDKNTADFSVVESYCRTFTGKPYLNEVGPKAETRSIYSTLTAKGKER